MDSSVGSPLVSVGIVTYDRPEGLKRTLECIASQSYRNLEIIVSDNCSPGEDTQKIVAGFMEKDDRIQYYRQEKNQGPAFNFKFVLNKSSGKFFMWAADDDEWVPEFVEKGIDALLNNPNHDLWFPSIVNIDSFGQVVREYPGFSRFSSTENKRNDIVKFLNEPEIMGRANIIYGIYRKPALAKTVEQYFFSKIWGSDHCFVLAFLLRFKLVCSDEVLLYKRVVGENDKMRRPQMIVIAYPNRRIFPFKKSFGYIHENYKAARGTKYKYLVLFILLKRLPMSFRNYLLKKMNRKRICHVLCL